MGSEMSGRAKSVQKILSRYANKGFKPLLADDSELRHPECFCLTTESYPRFVDASQTLGAS